jgi:hypothetical protein
MGLFQDIGKALSDAAQQGEDVAKHVFQQIVQHPDVLIPGVGLAFEGIKNLTTGKGLFGAGGGIMGVGGGPSNQPPIPPVLGGSGVLAGLLSAALQAGKTIAGTQPYTVTSLLGVPSAAAIVKNTDIGDMFSTANCTAFTSNDTFPWPFQSYRMRWTFSTVGGIPIAGGAGAGLTAVTDPAWIATLHAVFSNATEIARVALNNLGLRTSLSSPYAVSTVSFGVGYEIDTQPGVLWPVYYEKNGSYVMSVRTDHAIGTVAAGFTISTQLDGWVINDPTLTDADTSQIQATLDALMQGRTGNSSLISMLGRGAVTG